jgi:hypothetical protein
MSVLNDTPEERIARKVIKGEDEDGCWRWDGRATNGRGYVLMSYAGQQWLAHRFVYTVLVGDPGPTLDHLCRNRACVNPAHLEPVTNKVNILRGNGSPAHNARKTHCPRGHPFSEENTYLFTRKDGSRYRQCRTCVNAQSLARYYAEPPERKAWRAQRMREHRQRLKDQWQAARVAQDEG